ncbi:hypothetical protein V6N13_068206 [Hibiscus sabdariffa]
MRKAVPQILKAIFPLLVMILTLEVSCVGDPQGAPSALVTLVDAAPLCAVSETVPVSTPLAAANTATSLDEGEDNAVPEEEDCMFLRVFCLGMSMMFSFRGVSYAVAAPALDAIEE